MPDINMQVFEEAKRNQLVTEIDIQTQVALDNYQVQLSDIANPTQSQDNVVIDRFGEFLPHWNESLDFDTWVKMSMEVAGKRLLMLRGNSSVSSASDSETTFPILFDDFTGDLSKWNITGTVSIVSEQARISGNDVYGSNGMTSIATISKPNIIEYGVYQSALYHAMNGFSVQPLDIDKGLFWNMHTTGNFYYRVDASSTPSGTYTAGSIDDVKWELPSGNGFELFRNDVSRRVDTTWTNPNSANRVSFMQYSSGQYLFIDYVRVRKYASVEPTWTVDGEEQNIAVALKSLGRAG